MFTFGRSTDKPEEQTEESITIEVDAEDIAVEFTLASGEKLTREFKSPAFYEPSLTLSDNGVVVIGAGDALISFMARWDQTGWAWIGDAIVRFHDFASAKVTRTAVKIPVKVRRKLVFYKQA